MCSSFRILALILSHPGALSGLNFFIASQTSSLRMPGSSFCLVIGISVPSSLDIFWLYFLYTSIVPIISVIFSYFFSFVIHYGVNLLFIFFINLYKSFLLFWTACLSASVQIRYDSHSGLSDKAVVCFYLTEHIFLLVVVMLCFLRCWVVVVFN